MRIGPFKIYRVRKDTCLDRQYEKKIELAFELNGVEYFWFKDLADMPVQRYHKVSQFLAETDLRLTRADIQDYCQLISESLNKGNITRASTLIADMEYRNQMFIETETFYRLYSCVFFTKDEDLKEYDFGLGDEKIAIFKKEKIGSFFLQEPCRRFLPQVDISAEDLEAFLKIGNVRREFSALLKADKLGEEREKNE